MRKHILLAFGAAALALAPVLEAEARGRGFNRSGGVTGPRGGQATYEGGGACSGGSCTRETTVSDPGGRTISREVTATRDGEGGWERDVRVTGPNGGVYTREGQGACSGGDCAFSGTVTGPRGNTGVYSGSSTINP